MELLAFGKTGWGDELFYATLMTIAVSVTAMLVGFVFALIFTPLKLSKYKSLNLIGNFIKLSRDVHILNDDRAKIKLEINNYTGSKIKEIKEYTSY